MEFEEVSKVHYIYIDRHGFNARSDCFQFPFRSLKSFHIKINTSSFCSLFGQVRSSLSSSNDLVSRIAQSKLWSGRRFSGYIQLGSHSFTKQKLLARR